jgi:hypothetical protein
MQTSSVSSSDSKRAVRVVTGGDPLSTSWASRVARQDEYLRSWNLRGGIALALGFLAALAGLGVGAVPK